VGEVLGDRSLGQRLLAEGGRNQVCAADSIADGEHEARVLEQLQRLTDGHLQLLDVCGTSRLGRHQPHHHLQDIEATRMFPSRTIGAEDSHHLDRQLRSWQCAETFELCLRRSLLRRFLRTPTKPWHRGRI
jgi:hypothetical protein